MTRRSMKSWRMQSKKRRYPSLSSWESQFQVQAVKDIERNTWQEKGQEEQDNFLLFASRDHSLIRVSSSACFQWFPGCVHECYACSPLFPLKPSSAAQNKLSLNLCSNMIHHLRPKEEEWRTWNEPWSSLLSSGGFSRKSVYTALLPFSELQRYCRLLLSSVLYIYTYPLISGYDLMREKKEWIQCLSFLQVKLHNLQAAP